LDRIQPEEKLAIAFVLLTNADNNTAIHITAVKYK